MVLLEEYKELYSCDIRAIFVRYSCDMRSEGVSYVIMRVVLEGGKSIREISQ